MAKPRVVKLEGDTLDVELSPGKTAIITPRDVFIKHNGGVTQLSMREAQILAAIVEPLDGFDPLKKRSG